MTNNRKLELTEERLEKCNAVIGKMISSLSFFKQRLNDRPGKSDVATHMGLFESYFKELSEYVDYDSVLAGDLEKRNELVRVVSKENQELRKALETKQISAYAIEQELRKYQKTMRKWGYDTGFNYVLTEPNLTGMYCKLSNEVDSDSRIISIQNGYDLAVDGSDSEILNTDNNRKKMSSFLKKEFPNSEIHAFKSYKGNCWEYTLETEVNIPYADIENLYRRYAED